MGNQTRDHASVIATNRYLVAILERPGKYRQRWRAKLKREDGMQAAIAEVIANYLATHGAPEDQLGPRQLRSRVSRAMAKNPDEIVLSHTTLQLFIRAFSMSPDDTVRLEALFRGEAHIQYVQDEGATRLPIFDAPPQRHRTVSLREYHYLGPDGLPAEHHTDQVIEATADGLDRYPYVVDTDMLTVDVQNGAHPGPMYQLRARSGSVFHAVDLVLHKSLDLGETAALRYITTFHYREAPPPEMRRAFRQKVDSFLLWVQFHPDKVPRAVWWARWESLDGRKVIYREPAALDCKLTAHRFLEGGVEQAIVGFYWEW